jgi:dihydroneopterin aldolase
VESRAHGGDRVFLEGFVLTAKIGVTEKERAAGQALEAEIVLEADLEKAGLSDALSETIDYAEIRRIALQIAAARTWSLLEALAERIAGELLLKFPTAFSVAITLRKHRPPFMSGVKSAGVSLLRRRSPAAGP